MNEVTLARHFARVACLFCRKVNQIACKTLYLTHIPEFIPYSERKRCTLDYRGGVLIV